MHNIRTKANQYRSHKPHLRPPTAQWHNTIGKLNPGGHRGWTLSQAHRTHPQLSPGNSLRMVAAFRPVPPACDSISNRKATYRHPRSSTTRSVLPSQRGTTHRVIDYPAPGSWRCKQGCTATRSARCTGNWKPMAWWRPWPALASTCATNRNPGKSKRHPTSAIGASPISTGRCAGA